jgi:vancomycin resistance protein YoaR
VARSTRRDRPGPESEGGRVVVALILGLALLAGGIYVAAYVVAGDRIPVGTTVAGVDIGGKNPSSAMLVLRDGLASRADTPFTVSVNGQTQQVAPADVGLGVDYAASVHNAGAVRSWRMSRLWSYYTTGSSYQPVVTLDQNKLAVLLRRLDASVGRGPRDGMVVFKHHTFTVRQPRPGLVLDPRLAGTAFWNAYLTDDPSVDLRMSAVTPTINQSAIRRFVRRFANPAMSSAVELHFGPTSLRLSPSAYGHLLGARRLGKHLRPTVQARPLAHLARRQLAGAAINRPQPATVALVDGRPQVVSAQPGMRYAPHDIAVALLRAIASRDRSARVRPTPAKASFTSADARALGIRRQLASSTVRLAHGSPGDALTTAVGRIDGTVLKPHRSLSLRRLLGPATPDGAGGDALATAVFNAAWLGGLQVTAHATSSSYTGQAPLGRDATLAGGRDLAFTDNTRYGVLVSATADHGSVTVTLWSTPRWTVRSSHGHRTHVVVAGRHVQHGKGCTPRVGQDGFRVTVTRSFAAGGAVDHTTSYTVSYAPVAAVVCQSKDHHGHQHGHHHGHGHGHEHEHEH